MKTIKVLVLNPTGKPEIIEVLNDYKAFKQAINITSPIDCISRKIGDKYFEIWCDDEGLYKEDLKASAFCENANEILAGKILIANHRGEHTTSLKDEDIAMIIEHLRCVDEDYSVDYMTSMGMVKMNFNKKGVFLQYKI